MTDTTAAPDLKSLRALLANVDLPPVEHAEALRRQREMIVDDPITLLDLDRTELRFLERQARRAKAREELKDAVAGARACVFDRSLLRLGKMPIESVATVFDLAELRVAYEHAGREDKAAATDTALGERLEVVRLDTKLREEASERYAAIMTDEEDLGLPHKILLLRSTSDVMEALFERSGDKRYRKMCKRLRCAAGDRGLYVRLEKILGRRGVAVMETTSLLLLIIVLALLTVEMTVTLSPGAERNVHLIDAGICQFFILEFFFKLFLAPARLSWFCRNVVTDLLPAIPAVLMLPAQLASVRSLRFIRILQTARFARLLLLLIRGLDAVVNRFSRLTNRSFIFFESGTHRGDELTRHDPRRVAFEAIRREHVQLGDLAVDESEATLLVRAEALFERLRTRDIAVRDEISPVADVRDMRVEDAIERLYSLRPDEVATTMSSTDLMALNRVTRVINAPFIRSLPFVRAFRSTERGATPEQRVVNLGRRIADNLEKWRGRILFFADLHGIVTGPQILDRLATAMVNASKRPAVRLLMFGALFSIVRMFVSDDNPLNEILKRFVATPLVVLGGVCFVILLVGRWFKRLAGEATESLKRTSEAHFINLLELVKARTRDSDLVFLARRVFRFEMDAWEAALALGQQVEEASSIQIDFGGEHAPTTPPEAVREDLSRVAFLYMHFLDGAILHESDIKTTEQLLANLSLENIRRHHLRFSRRDHKRVKKLSLASGSILTGPYLWFRFITESVSLETAKRITEYNRHCITLQQRAVSSPEEIQDMEEWMAKRRAQIEGRIVEKLDPPDSGAVYLTTEFNSMDFLAVNERRDAQIKRVFGPEILEVLQLDRRNMIREIFGTRPLHRLPQSKRSVNFYRFFINRLSHGRVLLAPILFLGAVWWLVKSGISRVSGIVHEILSPETANARRGSGRAPFRVALRKIHRMKAPGLLEAMRMRACFDAAYCGAPPTWSFGVVLEEVPEFERDMDFLQMRERERAVMGSIAADNCRHVEQLHDIVRDLHVFEGIFDDEMDRKLAERAVTIAYITDRDNLRSLFQAERWIDRELAQFDSPDVKIKVSWAQSCRAWLRRGCKAHPVRRLLETKLADRALSKRGRRNFENAWSMDIGNTRSIVGAWQSLPNGVAPSERATQLAVAIYCTNGEVSRELVALRAVQSLSVLDVRNYRDLVFRLGGYEEDGEDPAVSQALP